MSPRYERPQLPESRALEAGAFLRGGDEEDGQPVAKWWDDLDDPTLAELIETGLDRAPAVDAARARLRLAREGITATRSALFPVLSSSATYVYADLPNQAFGTGGGANEFFTLGFDAQWEVDLWGGRSSDLRRSKLDADAAAAMLADAQVSLSSEIARTYVGLRARQAAREFLGRRLELETQLSGIAKHRFEAGTGTKQELLAAQQKMGRTNAEIAAVDADIASLQDGLAVLTGEAPGALDDLAPGAIPLPPAEVAVGDPAAMLERRPDVRAAERRLAAATAGIGVAKANRFPAVSLLGLVGIGGQNIGDAFDTSQLSALAIPRLTWNFLDFGRRAAEVRGAEARRDEALAQYRASILSALHDAEGALARFGAARIAFAEASQTLQQSVEMQQLQQLRSDAGSIAESDASRARINALDAAIGEANGKANLTLSFVALAKSLGLGWQGEPPSKH